MKVTSYKVETNLLRSAFILPTGDSKKDAVINGMADFMERLAWEPNSTRDFSLVSPKEAKTLMQLMSGKDAYKFPYDNFSYSLLLVKKQYRSEYFSGAEDGSNLSYGDYISVKDWAAELYGRGFKPIYNKNEVVAIKAPEQK